MVNLSGYTPPTTTRTHTHAPASLSDGGGRQNLVYTGICRLCGEGADSGTGPTPQGGRRQAWGGGDSVSACWLASWQSPSPADHSLGAAAAPSGHAQCRIPPVCAPPFCIPPLSAPSLSMLCKIAPFLTLPFSRHNQTLTLA